MDESVLDVMSGRLSHRKDRRCLNSHNNQDLRLQGDKEVRHADHANEIDEARGYKENAREDEEEVRHERRENAAYAERKLEVDLGALMFVRL